MSKKKENTEKEEITNTNQENIKNINDLQDDILENTSEECVKNCNPEEQLKTQLAEMNDKYMRLAAEFDNYKKRTLRERIELIKTAGEDYIKNLLPVIDDFERAKTNIDNAKNVEAIKTGIELIYNKFIDFLKQQGVQKIDAMHQEFDTDKHEAITKIATPDENLKGKVIDVVKNGYCLHDKVIRYTQVVIGE